jgi:hypothetical protein
MNIFISFLITDGKNIILSNDHLSLPTIKCEKDIGKSCKDYLEKEFLISGEWTNSIKLVGYSEDNNNLVLFKSLLVPDSFNLKSEWDWASIPSLHNIIKELDKYCLIISFLNSI